MLLFRLLSEKKTIYPSISRSTLFRQIAHPGCCFFRGVLQTLFGRPANRYRIDSRRHILVSCSSLSREDVFSGGRREVPQEGLVRSKHVWEENHRACEHGTA